MISFDPRIASPPPDAEYLGEITLEKVVNPLGFETTLFEIVSPRDMVTVLAWIAASNLGTEVPFVLFVFCPGKTPIGFVDSATNFDLGATIVPTDFFRPFNIVIPAGSSCRIKASGPTADLVSGVHSCSWFGWRFNQGRQRIGHRWTAAPDIAWT